MTTTSISMTFGRSTPGVRVPGMRVPGMRVPGVRVPGMRLCRLTDGKNGCRLEAQHRALVRPSF